MDSVNHSHHKQLLTIRNFLELFKSSQFDLQLNDDFNRLRDFTNEIRIFNTKNISEGERECNKRKNRYRDIIPYDETRVILDDQSNESCKWSNGNDYINASFISNPLNDYYKYIACQGPTKETVVDFLRMLKLYNIKVVICACNEYEGQKLKCHRYWTDKINQNYNFCKNYYVSLKNEPTEVDGCIIRDLVVRYNNTSSLPQPNSNEIISEYEFTQYHLINWPDHGVPNNIEPVINIINKVRNKMFENNNKSSNMIPLGNEYLAVHCSAGCGRTGTIIAIDQVWSLMNENKLDSDFNLFKIARALREQRIAMIQTFSQYQFFAKAIAFLFEKHLENLKETKMNSDCIPVKTKYTQLNDNYYDNNFVQMISPLNYHINTDHDQQQLQINLNKQLNIDIDCNNNDSEYNSFPKSQSTSSTLSQKHIKKNGTTDKALDHLKKKVYKVVPNLFTSTNHNKSSKNISTQQTNIIENSPTISNNSSTQSNASISQVLSTSSTSSPKSPASESSKSSSSNSTSSSAYIKSLNDQQHQTQSQSSNPRLVQSESVYDNNEMFYSPTHSILSHNKLPPSTHTKKQINQISTPISTTSILSTSTMSSGTKHTKHKQYENSSDFLVQNHKNVEHLSSNESITVATSGSLTPTRSPMFSKKLSNNSVVSSSLSEANMINKQLENYGQMEFYLNDINTINGSAREFLSNKFNNNINSSHQTQKYKQPGPFNLSSSKSFGVKSDEKKSELGVNGQNNISENSKQVKLVENQVKYSKIDNTIDLTKLNPPSKAEIYENVFLKQQKEHQMTPKIENTNNFSENFHSEKDPELAPKAPLRSKIKRFIPAKDLNNNIQQNLAELIDETNNKNYNRTINKTTNQIYSFSPEINSINDMDSSSNNKANIMNFFSPEPTGSKEYTEITPRLLKSDKLLKKTQNSAISEPAKTIMLRNNPNSSSSNFSSYDNSSNNQKIKSTNMNMVNSSIRNGIYIDFDLQQDAKYKQLQQQNQIEEPKQIKNFTNQKGESNPNRTYIKSSRKQTPSNHFEQYELDKQKNIEQTGYGNAELINPFPHTNMNIADINNKLTTKKAYNMNGNISKNEKHLSTSNVENSNQMKNKLAMNNYDFNLNNYIIQQHHLNVNFHQANLNRKLNEMNRKSFNLANYHPTRPIQNYENFIRYNDASNSSLIKKNSNLNFNRNRSTQIFNV